MSASRPPPLVPDCPRCFQIRRTPRGMDGSAFWRALLRCNGHSSVEPFVYEHSAVSQPASCSAALLPEPPRHCVPVLAVLTPPSQNLPGRLSSALYLALASTRHGQALGTQQHSFCPPPPICCFVLKHAPPGASCCRSRSLNLLPSPPPLVSTCIVFPPTAHR